MVDAPRETDQPFIQRLWNYLWRLNAQTKAYLRLDGPAIVRDMDGVTDEEKRLAEKAFADGGRNPGDGNGPGADPGSGGDRDDDDGNPFDVGGGSYGLRQKIGFVLGPLLFALIYLSPTPEDSRQKDRRSPRSPPGSPFGGCPRQFRSLQRRCCRFRYFH